MTRIVILAALLSVSCGRAPAERRDQAEEWNQWARGVEARYPVGDADGHGPDIGSDEWAAALQRKLGIVDGQGHGPDIGSAEWRAAVESKLSE
jgi:hypothetical protein